MSERQDHRPMADGTEGAVPSGSMEASPAIDPRATVPESALPLPGAGAESRSPAVQATTTAPRVDPAGEPDAEGMSLARRLRQPRTILSIAIPIAVIAIFVALNGGQLSKVPGLVLHANPLLVLAALVVFYAGFPLRGLRWSTLLEGTGLRVGMRDSMEIIFLSWLVNCVVPAKLGDVYRAYLLKINSTASLSRTFGTVFIERILDLFAIATLGLAAGYWSFRDGLPPAIQLVFGIGIVVVVVLGVALFTMRNFGRQIIVALPLPHQVLELYDRFEEGVFGALVARHLPKLGVMTGLIWMTEAFRLYLVVQALSFADVSLGLSGAVFVALIGSLLTAVPLSPAGLGIVEAGVVGVLHVAYGVPLPEATAIALLDRVISVFSIIVFGSIAYAVSSKPRGLGRIDGSADAPSAASTAA
jgi:glycosyltransferase 2 family protein